MRIPNSGRCVKLKVGRRSFLEALLSGFPLGAALLRACGSFLPGPRFWCRAIRQSVALAVDGLQYSVWEDEPSPTIRINDLEEHQEARGFGPPRLHDVGDVLLDDGHSINDRGWPRHLDAGQSFKPCPYAVKLRFVLRWGFVHSKSFSAPAIRLLRCLAGNLVASATYILSYLRKAPTLLSEKSLFQIQNHAPVAVKSPRYLAKTNFSYFPIWDFAPPGGKP